MKMDNAKEEKAEKKPSTPKGKVKKSAVVVVASKKKSKKMFTKGKMV